MLAQWISWAAQRHFQEARTEPLITIGSAPLDVPGFRAAVLGQIGEARLDAAIDADLAGQMAHAKALDSDSSGPLRNIHQRVGTAILFESSGGQVDKVAHLPELRFALGEPNVDTTTIDNAATTLEGAGFFIRKVSTDGFRIHHQATLKKVVSDRKASLDEETEIRPAVRKLVHAEFDRDRKLPMVAFPEDGTAVPDLPQLTLVLMDPDSPWTDEAPTAERVAEWTTRRGRSARVYSGALVWCIKKPGRALREQVELRLAWQRVEREIADGVLGTDFTQSDRAEIRAKAKDAEDMAKEEVWGSYRFAVIADPIAESGLKTIDLGAGHSSSNETLPGTRHNGPEVPRPPERHDRRELSGAALAACAQRERGVAVDGFTQELRGWLADAADQPRGRAAAEDRGVRTARRVRVGVRDRPERWVPTSVDRRDRPDGRRHLRAFGLPADEVEGERDPDFGTCGR